MSNPRVAIAMAIYKPDLGLLRLQLESLVRQSYANWYLVAHDDQSMSVDELSAFIHDVVGSHRALIVSGERRRGAVGNFAAALAHVPADCELVAFCDQDDEWKPSKLERMVREFADPRIMAAHSDLELIDVGGRPLADSCWRVERRDISENLSADKVIFRNPVTGCAMMFRSSLLPSILPIPEVDPRRPAFYHDAWVALAALARGEVRAVREPLVRYRQHGGNAVGAAMKTSLPISSLREKCVGAYETRRVLERLCRERFGASLAGGVFTRDRGCGLGILARAVLWSILYSRGYLRIGLQMALGKFFWALGSRALKASPS